MDIKELKKLLKSHPSILILDDGEPVMTVMSYDAYKNLLDEKEVSIHPQEANGRISKDGDGSNPLEAQILERLNREIAALKSQIESEEKGVLDNVDILD